MNAASSRRGFFRSAAAVAAATTLPRWFLEQSAAAAQAQPTSPNDQPGIALIGCGGRGKGVARDAAAHGPIVRTATSMSRLAEAKQRPTAPLAVCRC
jgi:hypothetical protein